MEPQHSLGNTTQQLLLKELTNATYNQQIKSAWTDKDDPEEKSGAALPHLILLANNKTAAHSRLTAAQWLCRHKYGLSAAVTALIELAFDANPDVSRNALAQLETLDDPQAVKALKGLVKWGANRDMRSTARHYLLRKTAQQKSLFINDEFNDSEISFEEFPEPFLTDQPVDSTFEIDPLAEPFLNQPDQEESDSFLTFEEQNADTFVSKTTEKVELLTTSSMLVTSELDPQEGQEPFLSAPLPLPVAMSVTASQRSTTAEATAAVQTRQINQSDAQASTPEVSASPTSGLSELLLQLFRHDYKQPLWFPTLLLALTTIGELLFLLPDPVLGMGMHIGVLFILLYSLIYVPDRPVRRLNTVLLLVPIIRMMSLGLPLAELPQISWYFLTSLPILAAIALIARSKDDPWRREELGLTLAEWPIQIEVALTGLGIGLLEYFILTPTPLSTDLSLAAIWLPALILLLSTGFLEELLFRGVLQTAAIPVIGRWPALLFISALFAVLHIGYASVIDVLFVFAVGLSFALVVERTHSILGVTLAHAIANISLYLIWPHLLG